VNEQEQYWFNIKTKKVEKGLKSKALERIGPFKTEAEASRAEEIVRERSKEWQTEEEEDR